MNYEALLSQPAPKGLSKRLLKVIQNRPAFRPILKDAGNGDTVIASYNVHKCIGVDKVFDPDRIAEVISEVDADVIAIQEADQRFGERSGLLNLNEIERNSGLFPIPITAISPDGHGWHGNLLLFRQGLIRDVRQIDLPGVEPRGAVIADLEFAGGPLRIVAAHLGLLKRSREQQAEALLKALENEDNLPTLIIGDLNEWRMGKRSSLAPLLPLFNPSSGVVPSFPSRFPVFALDRIMGAPHDLIKQVEVHDSPLARVASDHLPIKAHIDLRLINERLNPHLLKDTGNQAK